MKIVLAKISILLRARKIRNLRIMRDEAEKDFKYHSIMALNANAVMSECDMKLALLDPPKNLYKPRRRDGFTVIMPTAINNPTKDNNNG